MTLLTAQGMTGGYGGMDILHNVELAVDAGEIVVIVGPNGAGKSTAMKAIFGLVHLREGSVTFDGKDITNAHPDRLVRIGLGYVPQERNIFPNLSVHENLEMGAYIRRDDIGPALDHVYSLFPPLVEKRKQAAGELSGGQRQMVAFGRALMTNPKVLLLDEPTAGLSPLFMDEIFERIIAVNETGVGILMVEQNARQALELADRGYVLATGENRYIDTGPNLLADREVVESFLGGGGNNNNNGGEGAGSGGTGSGGTGSGGRGDG
jgi:branched-chain amino acid transport system ATP-binding protein